MGINFVSDEIVEMRYQYKEEFVEESGRTNVVIAAYTTAQARLKLFSYSTCRNIRQVRIYILSEACWISVRIFPKSYSASVWLMLVEERSLTGTWVTDELKKELEKGYVVQRIYEVWHFDETEQYDPETKTGGLFTGVDTVSVAGFHYMFYTE
jgi:hypothetical protein